MVPLFAIFDSLLKDSHALFTRWDAI